jgi:hypothetical protein
MMREKCNGFLDAGRIAGKPQRDLGARPVLFVKAAPPDAEPERINHS